MEGESPAHPQFIDPQITLNICLKAVQIAQSVVAMAGG